MVKISPLRSHVRFGRNDKNIITIYVLDDIFLFINLKSKAENFFSYALAIDPHR